MPPPTTLLQIEREEDILPIITLLDAELSTAKKGRAQQREERRCIYRLLYALSGDAHLSAPVSLIHSDRPDFRLTTGNREIGIEVTCATDRDFEWAKVLASETDGGLVDCSFFRPNRPISSCSSRAKPPIGNIYAELCGPGWLGDEAEHEWVEFLVRAIEKKTASLRQGYNHFEADWLLIRDKTPCRVVLEVDEAVVMLNDQLGEYWQRSVRFDAIFILTHGQVFEFTASGIRHGLLWNKQ